MSAQTTIRLGMTTLTVVPQEERLVDGEPADFASLEVRPEFGSVEAEVIDIGDASRPSSSTYRRGADDRRLHFIRARS